MLTEEFKKINPNISLKIVDAPEGINIDDLRYQILSKECQYDVVLCDMFCVRDLAAEKLLVPLNSYFRLKEAKYYYDNALNECTCFGEIFGLPDFLNSFCLIYRKELFNKHNITLPSNWSELVDKTKYILNKEKFLEHGLIYATDNNSIKNVFMSYLMSNSDTMDIGKEIMNYKNYKDVLGFMYDCVHKYKIVPEHIYQCNFKELHTKFKNGKALFSHDWAFNYLMKDTGLMHKYGFMSFPPLNKGGKSCNVYRGSAYVIPVTAKYPVFSAEVVKYLTSYYISKKIHEVGKFPDLPARYDVLEAMEGSGTYYVSAKKMLTEGILLNMPLDKEFGSVINNCVKNTVINEVPIDKELENTECKMKILEKMKFHNKIIDAAVRYMERGHNKKLYLKDISGVVNLSPFHFARMFKENKKMTVMEYLINIRINHAKVLLKERYSLNVSQIAQKTGFPNLCYFCNTFKRKTGFSPSEFRFNKTAL